MPGSVPRFNFWLTVFAQRPLDNITAESSNQRHDSEKVVVFVLQNFTDVLNISQGVSSVSGEKIIHWDGNIIGPFGMRNMNHLVLIPGKRSIFETPLPEVRIRYRNFIRLVIISFVVV